jgi:hypothetical protein
MFSLDQPIYLISMKVNPMKTMSYASRNLETDATELLKFRICAAFGFVVLYVFLVANANAPDIRSGATGLNGTTAQAAR